MAKLKDFRLNHRQRVRLESFDPAAAPLSGGDKDKNNAPNAELAVELAELQDRFFALRRNKLLLVLQGMDTSGKDGTIRAVFQAIDPLGVRAVSYRAPTDPEKQRDFLWRHHRDVPGVGEVVIFNRSHYEAVLIEWVHAWIDKDERKRRFGAIRDFERLLVDSGTTIVKCFLHISKDEQRRRLQERIDNHDKHWKFNRGDLQERKLWDKYQQAYADALEHTATSYAPWHVVPSDSKTHRNLMVSELLCATLRPLAPSYPPPDKTLIGLKVR
jgi:PPK2 family polyphosphate:nucleotide phosphotransferase